MENQQPQLIEQGISVIKHLRATPDFISKNKLWKGFWNNGWISKVTLVIAAICSLKMISQVRSAFTFEGESEVVSMGFFQGVGQVGNNLLMDSGMKYLILIVLEIVIFYFSVKTYEILSGNKRQLEFKDFINAQIRMIKVAFLAWIYELIIGIILSIVFGMFHLDILSKIFNYFVEFFFIGAAFMDNYNEQFELRINDSFKKSFRHFGAALVIGIVAYALLLIPIVGAIFTPFLCSVAATTYLFYSENSIHRSSELT